MTHWILEGHEPKAVDDVVTWARWFETAERGVERTETPYGDVSTVFLGIDHNFLGEGPPILFETMIFHGDMVENYQERYSTWDEAVSGHARAVALVLSRGKL